MCIYAHVCVCVCVWSQVLDEHGVAIKHVKDLLGSGVPSFGMAALALVRANNHNTHHACCCFTRHDRDKAHFACLVRLAAGQGKAVSYLRGKCRRLG